MPCRGGSRGTAPKAAHLYQDKHTSYTQSPIFGHFPRGKNRSFFRALEAVDFALGRKGDFEAGKNRRGLFPAEVLASVFGDSALSALFRRNSRGEVFAAVFKFLLGWAEFYRDSDRLIGLPGGLPVRTPFPRETYGYLFPFPLKGQVCDQGILQTESLRFVE